MAIDKLKTLLELGYFPVQLPPAFTTVSFAKKYKKLQPIWDIKNIPRNRPEKFSVARSSYNRRGTSIVNPVSYYSLAKQLSIYWPKIQNHFSKSRFSYSRPKIERGIRAIRINRFSDIHDFRILKSAGYQYVLITDISRFFPTIYTHSIPWALHGKEVAKVNRKKTARFFGNILDNESMSVQDFQTIGLPIGPDTSHVIAEIIGTAIDCELKAELGYWPSGFRYVDDFYLFFNSRAEAEASLSSISRVAAKFELQINAQKTRIIETREMIEESWKYKLKGITVSDERHTQRDDIHKFFESLLTLEKTYQDESVVKYGLKVLSSKIIKKPNWDVFESYLLHCGFAYPNTLQILSSIFATYETHGYPINRKAVTRFCNAIITNHALSDHHSEVTWALWTMIELKLKLSQESIESLETLSNSVCTLLALTVFKNSNPSDAQPFGNLNRFATRESLYKEEWLLAYEGGKRRWLDNSSLSHINDDPHFAELIRNDVSFYDENIRLTPIFKLRRDAEDDFNEGLFDTDGDLDHYFDFDNLDEEYFDSSSPSAIFDDEPEQTQEPDEPDYIDF